MALNFRSLVNALRMSVRALDRMGRATKASPGNRAPRPAPPGTQPPPDYPGDFHGTATVRYAPHPDGAPDPGEVVWTWVPYEEDHTRGKDRPVLLIGHNDRYLLGLMLTSRDHDQDHHANTDYVDIGTGAWDRQSRPSEAKLDRILQISPDRVRREGAVLDRDRFDLVAARLRRRHGWN